MKKIRAILGMRCPTCYEGKLYVDPNPFHFRKLHVMHKNCDKCGQSFDPEPGFYFGAMYVSYGLSVNLFLMFFFFSQLVYEMSGLVFISSYTISLMILFPFIFRYSRTVYIHMFFSYNPNAQSEYRAKQKIKEEAEAGLEAAEFPNLT